MVSEWDLVCENNIIVGLVQSMFTLGLGTGVVLFTSLGDRFGRKYVYIFDIVSVISSEIGLVFAPNIYMAIALRFITGFAAGGMGLLHCIMSYEMVITKHRQTLYAVDCMWWSFNCMLLASIAYLLRDSDWRILQATAPAMGFPILIAAFFVNETPVWYFAKGRYDDCRKILRKICRMNNKKVEEVMELFQDCINEAKLQSAMDPSEVCNTNSDSDNTSRDDSTAVETNYTLIDIFRNRYLFKIIIISGVIWFTNSLAYYGLYLTSSTLAGDRFLNFFLMAVLEIPSSITCIILCSFFGRKTVVATFMSLSGFSLLVSSILVALNSDSSNVAYASTAFFLLGKFAIGSSFNIISCYTPEYLVTTIRSAGTGICSMFSRTGGVLAPFLLPLFNAYNWAPGAILTFFCFICLLIIPVIPETKGRQLPNNIEEVMQWRKIDKNKNKDLVI